MFFTYLKMSKINVLNLTKKQRRAVKKARERYQNLPEE